MTRLTIDIPDGAALPLGASPQESARELLFAAVAHWYSRGEIGGSQAGRLLGISRIDFYDELARHGIPITEYTADELEAEVAHVKEARS